MITIDELKVQLNNKSRLIGIDMGTKRIGVSICDENRKIATPYETIEYNNIDNLISRLKEIILENNIKIHNFYVPAGGDVPDVKLNEKFNHKLKFVKEMTKFFNHSKHKNTILVGDLNIAPLENDVWSHNQLKNVISHTEIEREKLIKILNKGKFVDTIKLFISPPKNLFTWWSYRSKDFRKNNRGRRLDHIWVSDSPSIKITDVKIIDKMRALEKPSDHVPVFCKFSLA